MISYPSDLTDMTYLSRARYFTCKPGMITILSHRAAVRTKCDNISHRPDREWALSGSQLRSLSNTEARI